MVERRPKERMKVRVSIASALLTHGEDDITGTMTGSSRCKQEGFLFAPELEKAGH